MDVFTPMFIWICTRLNGLSKKGKDIKLGEQHVGKDKGTFGRGNVIGRYDHILLYACIQLSKN